MAATLLAEGFGKKAFSLDDYSLESLKFIVLKGRKIGLAVLGDIQVKEIFLHERYGDQGIDLPTVESFYSERKG